MSSLARRLAAADPPGALLRGQCAVFLADGDDAKARLLNGSARELLVRWDGLRPGTAVPLARAAQPFVIRGRDFQGGAIDVAGLAARLSADSPSARAAQLASEALRTDAAALLDDAGASGRIPRLLERLRALDAELMQALGEEAALAARIEALDVDVVALAPLERERARRVAEDARWGTLLRLAPTWQRLAEAHRALEPLAAFAAVPADAPQRLAALEGRGERADSAGRSLAHRATQLRRERDAVATDAPLERIAAETQRLSGELATYRSRLLELAGARARVAELERALDDALRRLGPGWDVARVAATVVESARAQELNQWQERFRDSRSAHDEAERALAAARARLEEAATRVRADLAREEPVADASDACWRALWQLRAALEEIWQVQSRAESKARALLEHEASLQAAEAARQWLPSPRFDRRVGSLATLAGLAALWGNMAQVSDWPPMAACAALVLGLARLGLYLRRRWAGVQEQQRDALRDRLGREIDRLRRGRDGDWSRAAQLTGSIDTASARLGLTTPVTPEAVEVREQELAARLRSEGPNTDLGAHLMELLHAQDDEQSAAAAVEGAATMRRALEQEWESWRAGVELPPDVDAEHGEEWLAQLQRVSATAAARDAARAALLDTEPAIAAWERDARTLLRRVSTSVPDDLCGSDLVAALGAVHDRVRREQEARQRRARLEAELLEVELHRQEAEAERVRAAAGWKELLAAVGVADAAALRARVEGFQRWRAHHEAAERIAAAIGAALSGLESEGDLRAELARNDPMRWEAERSRLAAQIAALDRGLGAAAERRRALGAALEAGRNGVGVAALRLEREDLLTQVAAAGRSWQARVLAAALLDDARREHVGAQRGDLLRAASKTLSTLSAGEYSAIAAAGDGLVLVDRAARRLPVGNGLAEAVRRQVVLSLLLGRALQRAGNGADAPVVLDDILSSLPPDEVGPVAVQIAALARTHPTIYLTTRDRQAAVIAALPGAVAVGAQR